MDLNANQSFPGSAESIAEQAISQVQARSRVQQHQSTKPRPAHSERTVQHVIAMNRAIYRIARHWVLAVNSLLFLYFAQLLLAPALVVAGQRGLAQPIYSFNGLFCHQDPDRSFFVFGQKMACCQRCAAIYGGLFMCGLVYAACRRHLRMPKLTFAGLLVLPIVVDGGTQLIGLHQSNMMLRVITGALFAIAVCWLMFPYLETGFAAMRTKIEERFTRLVAEGRAQPL